MNSANLYKRNLFFSSLFLLLFSIEAFAKYTYQGVHSDLIEKLHDQVPESKDGDVDFTVVDKIIEFLIQNSDYEKVTAVEIDKSTIEFQATSLRGLESVTIVGNNTFSSSQLMEVIEIKEGTRLVNKAIIEAGQRLDQFYQDQGYFNAHIEVAFKKAKPSKDTIVEFKIREGKPCKIKSVQIISANEKLTAALQLKIKKQINKPFSLEHTTLVEKNITDHLRLERYLKASLEQVEAKYNKSRTEAYLVYSVQEPYRYELVLEGNEEQSTPTLFRVVQFSEFDRDSLDPISEITERIRNHYLNLGYHHVRIRTDLKEVESLFTRQLKLSISEGPRVKLLRIVIQGDITLPSSYFSKFLKNNSSELVKLGYYNKQDFITGFRNLETDLKNQGFLQARIQSDRVEFINNNSQAILTVTVFEGPLTQVRKITFTGAHAFSQLELMEQIDLESNTPLRLYKLEKSIEKLKKYYQDRGYLEMTITNQDRDLIVYYSEGTQANIDFKIIEGPQVTVGSILLEGNKYTKDYVILKELDFNVGDTLTPDNLEESKQRLNKTGHFSRVEIRTLEAGTTVSRRTVIVAIEERQPGLFNIGAGFTSERELTARGFVGLGYRNIGGTGRAATSRLELRQNLTEYHYLQNKLTLGYLEPYLFMTRVKGRVNGTHDVYIDRYNDKEQVATIRRSDKLDFLLESDITSKIKFTWTAWSLDLIKEFQEPRTLTDFNEKQLQIATIGPTIDVDFRDNSFLPTTGHYYRWDISYSNPKLGSSVGVDFIRTTMAYTHYLPISTPRWVWANGLRGGYLKNLSEANGSGVPVSQAFFLGGPTTVRGFSRSTDRERIPNQDELPIDESNDLIIEDESHFYMIKSELRFPLIGDFGGVVFYDGGAVLVSGVEFDKSYRHAAGFGFRYNTPVGPVSLDVGIKLDPQPGEAKHQIYLSIGTF